MILMVRKMKYLKKIEISDEMFTEKEKKKIKKYYEKEKKEDNKKI